MWLLKQCPKCGGDVFVDKDSFGVYLDCVQCGTIYEGPSLVKGKSKAGKWG